MGMRQQDDKEAVTHHPGALFCPGVPSEEANHMDWSKHYLICNHLRIVFVISGFIQPISQQHKHAKTIRPGLDQAVHPGMIIKGIGRVHLINVYSEIQAMRLLLKINPKRPLQSKDIQRHPCRKLSA